MNEIIHQTPEVTSSKPTAPETKAKKPINKVILGLKTAMLGASLLLSGCGPETVADQQQPPVGTETQKNMSQNFSGSVLEKYIPEGVDGVETDSANGDETWSIVSPWGIDNNDGKFMRVRLGELSITEHLASRGKTLVARSAQPEVTTISEKVLIISETATVQDTATGALSEEKVNAVVTIAIPAENQEWSKDAFSGTFTE